MQRNANSLWGNDATRLTPTMLAADPLLDRDPLRLLTELLKSYRNDDYVFDLWAIAQALKESFGW